jgi:putative ABC transport system permease protein
MKPRGSMDAVFAIGAIGLLILSTASVNFVNLMTARASRRAIEVGVRKVCGAARRHLTAQFIGESVIYALISMGLGLGLAALSLPGVNRFLDRTIRLTLLSDAIPGALAITLTVLVGVLAGLYPAVVLSSFRPAGVLKAAASQGPASATVRQSLVMLQFALLISLLIATTVIERQVNFALTDAQRLDADEVVVIDQTCRPAFKDAVAALSGVRAATCSYSLGLTDRPLGGSRVTRPGGESIGEFRSDIVDPGFFEFYGFTPIAGRFLDGRASDAAPQRFSPRTLVINETMVRKLGFASPQAAIGQTLIVPNGSSPSTPEIVGVVADFATDTIRNPVQPTFFYVDPTGYSVTGMGGKKFELGMLSIRLVGAQAPETLTEIDRLWKQTGSGQPISRFFLKQSIQARVADLSRQGTLFGVAAAVAIFIALLGLFGMSVFVAEHRTKEIGIRKAMGATRKDILRQLLWQFTKPVLSANLVAWPTTYYFMKRWLEGFAYHVDLEPWSFLAASALAVAIAVLTVTGHALLVARAQPVAALRYE